MIYLDNAATTLHKPPQVACAVLSAMTTMGNAARGAHESALDAARTIYNTREKLARFFGCKHPEHVIFAVNATEALNIALCGLFNCGDHVITTDCEHNSVLRPLYYLEEIDQISLSFLPADKYGRLAYGLLDSLLQANTRAIVCTHASNLTGNITELSAMSAFAKLHGLMLIVDASQTAGCGPIDMEALGIDVLCFTGHKGLMGPQGTGGLCLRDGIEIRPWKRGGSGVHSYDKHQPEAYPTRLEAGTLNGHGIAGLSAALDFLEETSLEEIHRKESELMWRFYRGVSAIDGVHVYGDFSWQMRTAIVTLNIRDYDSGAVSDALYQDYGIATRSGAHCAPRMHRALGTVETGAVRFSFSYFNTIEEVDFAVNAVRELAEE